MTKRRQHKNTIQKEWLTTFKLVFKSFIQDGLWSRDIASLTYNTFLAIVPFTAMLMVVAQIVGRGKIIDEWLATTFQNQPDVAIYLSEFVDNYIANTNGRKIVIVGVLFMLYSVFSLMKNIETAFNVIWHTKERGIIRMFGEYIVMFVGCILMILVPSTITSVLNVFSDTLNEYFIIGDVWSMTIKSASFLFMTLFFMFANCSIPNTKVNWRNTLLPSILSATLMIGLQYSYFMIQAYLTSYNVIYGSFAALPLFLLWLQLSWTITIFGVMLCYNKQNISTPVLEKNKNITKH